MQFLVQFFHAHTSEILAALPGIGVAFISEWMGTHPGSKYDSILQFLIASLQKKSPPQS